VVTHLMRVLVVAAGGEGRRFPVRSGHAPGFNSRGSGSTVDCPVDRAPGRAEQFGQLGTRVPTRLVGATRSLVDLGPLNSEFGMQRSLKVGMIDKCPRSPLRLAILCGRLMS